MVYHSLLLGGPGTVQLAQGHIGWLYSQEAQRGINSQPLAGLFHEPRGNAAQTQLLFTSIVFTDSAGKLQNDESILIEPHSQCHGTLMEVVVE